MLERNILERNVIEGFARTLPRGWAMRTEPAHPRSRLDAILWLQAPGGVEEQFAVEVRTKFYPNDVLRVMPLLTEGSAIVSAPPLLLAEFLSMRTREMLRDRSVAHADVTGNIWISTSKMHLEARGAIHPPLGTAVAQGRRSLEGRTAARIVRALAVASLPIGVRRLAEASFASAGTVSRLLDFAETEALVERKEGRVVEVHIRELIKAWGDALRKRRPPPLTLFSARGPEDVERRATSVHTARIAVTGSWAGELLAPAAYESTIDLYAEDVREAREQLRLEDADGVGNVRLHSPFDGVVWKGVRRVEDVPVVHPVQIVADMLSLPHRSNEQVTAVFDWMEKHVDDWRA